jgi:hypothetical protein
MANYPKFSLGTNVVVDNEAPRDNYNGTIEEIMMSKNGPYYRVVRLAAVDELWVKEQRLSIDEHSIQPWQDSYLDSLDSWDAT